jgi:hypothetical protein
MVTPEEVQNGPTVHWDRPIFSVGGGAYSRRDVVAAARLRGDWRDLEDRLRAGLACVKRARSTAFPPIDLSTAAEEFRYARNLLTAEETEQWLERFGVTFDEWTAYLQRTQLRQEWATEIDDTRRQYGVDEHEIAACIDAEAVCSGALARFAEILAGRVAVCARPDPHEPPDLHDLAALEATFQMRARSAITPSALQAQVEGHCLDWIRVCWRYVTFNAKETANEAALCLIHDGEPLDEVARRGRSPIRAEERLLETIDPPVRDLVLSAKPGDVVGPIAADGAFDIAIIDSRRAPTLEDADVRRRAEQGVVAGLVAERLKQVRWHETL